LQSIGQFPAYRPRRLRQSAALRQLVAETHLSASQLVLPLFVRAGRKICRPIAAMPGVFQLSPDELLREAIRAHTLGVPAVLLFGIPDRKDTKASGAYAKNGIVQQAVRLLKKNCRRCSSSPTCACANTWSTAIAAWWSAEHRLGTKEKNQHPPGRCPELR